MTLTVKTRFAALVAIVVFLAGQLTWSQANRATITGIVTDQTGAIVPGAEVTATNTATNVSTKGISNNVGIYVIPNLFPGLYSVTFEKDGFEELQRPSVTLHSTEEARIDAALK